MTTATYHVPDSPADPEAAALELIVRRRQATSDALGPHAWTERVAVRLVSGEPGGAYGYALTDDERNRSPMSTNPTANANYQDVALAARFVAALAAEDQPGWVAVIAEVRQSGRMEKLAVALGTRLVQVAGEFYDTDRQAILDEFAFDANAMANRERENHDGTQ